MARIALKCSAAFIFVGILFGQVNTGTISGLVTDPSGAAIPGAQVKSANEQTGLTRTTTSNSAGQYTFSFLPLGSYSVTANAKGFKSEARTGLAVSAGQILTLDVSLQVGEMTQTVTVSTAPPLLNYSSPEQQSTLSSSTVHQLPLAKQDWSSLLSTTVNGVQNSGNSVTMNGLPPGAMNLTVDGTNAQSDPETAILGSYGGFSTITAVNTSAIAEVSVTKGIAPASAGAGMAGNINIITKSGTNQFHGSAFEYNGNSAFDARNQFLSSKPHTNFNQFGASLGGPILKNRLFFFGSYEGVRNPTFSLVHGDVPTPEFVQSTLAVAPEYAPVFQVFPAPNQAYSPGSVTGRYESAGSDVKKDSNSLARLDYYINPTNQLTLRVTRSRPSEDRPRVIAVDPRTYTGKTNLYNVQFTHSAGDWTASSRFGYNWMKVQRLDHGYDVGLDQIQFSGFDSSGGENFNLFGKTSTWQEDIALVHGKHTIKFGGVVQLFRDGRIDDTTSTFKYSSLSDFLSNIPSQIQINFPLTQFQLHRWQFGGYVQDDYRMLPNLTLNVGLRYDFWTVPRERDGRIFTRDASLRGPGTGPLRPPSQMYQSYWPNFAPRVGLSWSPGSSRKTVVRAGFGVFFNSTTIFGGPIDVVLDSPYVPFRLTLDRTQALAMGLNFPVNKQAVQDRLIASQVPVATTAMNDYFPNPYSLQYMADIQHDFGHGFVLDTGYIGTRGIHISLEELVNLPDRLTGIVPDPRFGQFKYYQGANVSKYDAWQTSLTRRFRNGVQIGVNYTLSRSYAYDSGGDIGAESVSTQDNNNFRADYGPTNFDVPSSFSANVVYLLPFGSWTHESLIKAIVGGWQLSGIFTASSGSPSNVENGDSSYPADRPDRAGKTSAYYSDYSSTLQYLNPAAFTLVPMASASGAQIRPGDLTRNFIRGPGMLNLDFGLAKNFQLGERVRFELRGDFFNGLNHTNLSGLQTNINSSSFGRLRSATARSIQLGARLTF
jgi:outer membrane receptor protein involved in Fe transport